jgi:hypothetical protein
MNSITPELIAIFTQLNEEDVQVYDSERHPKYVFDLHLGEDAAYITLRVTLEGRVEDSDHNVVVEDITSPDAVATIASYRN